VSQKKQFSATSTIFMLLIMSAAVSVAVLRTDMFRLWRVPISSVQLRVNGKMKKGESLKSKEVGKKRGRKRFAGVGGGRRTGYREISSR